MNTTALFIGLCPVIGWGLFPTIASKIGGRPVNQILGTTLGAFIFALVFSIITQTALPQGRDLFFSLLSGIGWAMAQIITFKSFELVGSSKALPITTAVQLLVTALWGAFYLGNWPGTTNKIIGLFALVLIVIGARFTVWTEMKNEQNAERLKKAVILLIIGGIGYWAYSAAPQATNVSGQAAFLPQAIGMLFVAILYSGWLSFTEKGEKSALSEKLSYQHILSGIAFAFAALTYLISAQPNMNGLATGFILSQTSVVIGTLTGIYFLSQKKTKKEMTVTLSGLALIIFAATLTVMI
ncbi:ribose/proton symporter RbsU [Enterococcus sp. LJL98]